RRQHCHDDLQGTDRTVTTECRFVTQACSIRTSLPPGGSGDSNYDHGHGWHMNLTALRGLGLICCPGSGARRRRLVDVLLGPRHRLGLARRLPAEDDQHEHHGLLQLPKVVFYTAPPDAPLQAPALTALTPGWPPD